MKKQLAIAGAILTMLLGSARASADVAISDETQFGAFRLGGAIGLNIATFGGEDADTEIVEHTNKVGFAVTGLASMALHRYVWLTSGFMYSAQGARLSIRGEDQGSGDLDYVHIPVLVQGRAPLKSRLIPYVLFGPALGVLLRAAVNSNQGTSVDIKDDLPSLDVGLIFGLGVNMDVSSSGAVVLEGQHTIGLRSLYAHEGEDIKNRVWTFSLGYQHRFGR